MPAGRYTVRHIDFDQDTAPSWDEVRAELDGWRVTIRTDVGARHSGILNGSVDERDGRQVFDIGSCTIGCDTVATIQATRD